MRKLLGYVRYDSSQALEAMNALYRNELRLFQNLYLPSVKLLKKLRVGSRVRRVYDHPQTPLESRLQSGLASPQADAVKASQLLALRDGLDPFALSQAIDQELEHLYTLAHHRPHRKGEELLMPSPQASPFRSPPSVPRHAGCRRK